jgi:hypothetical protein
VVSGAFFPRDRHTGSGQFGWSDKRTTALTLNSHPCLLAPRARRARCRCDRKDRRLAVAISSAGEIAIGSARERGQQPFRNAFFNREDGHALPCTAWIQERNCAAPASHLIPSGELVLGARATPFARKCEAPVVGSRFPAIVNIGKEGAPRALVFVPIEKRHWRCWYDDCFSLPVS